MSIQDQLFERILNERDLLREELREALRQLRIIEYTAQRAVAVLHDMALARKEDFGEDVNK